MQDSKRTKTKLKDVIKDMPVKRAKVLKHKMMMSEAEASAALVDFFEKKKPSLPEGGQVVQLADADDSKSSSCEFDSHPDQKKDKGA